MSTSKRPQRVIITTIILALFFACFCPTLFADQGELYVASELVLGMVDDYPIDSINAEYGTIHVQFLSQLNVYLLNTGGGVGLDSLAAAMENNPNVLFCHPNYLVDPMEPVQGSIPFGDLGGEGEYEGQEAATQLDLPNAHIITTGQNVTVGVIDGGINYNHPAFGNTVQSGYDYVDDDTDADDEEGGENSGHGTFAAGVLHLVAPGADIRAYRVTDLDGLSNGYLVAEAILQAVQDGCKVVNLSLVMMGEHLAIGAAVQYAKDNNVMVVVAAGNGQDDQPHYPANDPNTMAVAAVDSTLLLADFSSFGDWVDVCAPGTMIYSPYLDTSYAWWGGTSFAAPFVTGLAALMFSMDTEATWQDVHDAILASAIDIDDLNSGYDGQLGAGFIDPLASLLLLLGGASLYKVPDDYPTIQDAIDASFHGDTILVGPGTYYGRIRINSKTLYLIGEEGASNTILRPNIDYTQILNVKGTFLPGGCVKGFTFLGGGSTGASAVELEGASFLIIDNVFRECHPDSSTDKWVLDIENSTSTVTRNLFVDNFGASCVGVPNGVTVKNNTFDRNRVAISAGPWPDERYVYNNIITNSSVYGTQGSSWPVFTEVDYDNLWDNVSNYRYSHNAGDHDFYTDPMYVDPLRGDYRLLPGSPCIDGGHPDPLFNDPDGSPNDVGAYIYEPISLPLARNLTVGPLEAGNIVTTPNPWFAWEYYDASASIQAQYRIQVTTDPTFAGIDTWDSYPQASSDTSVTYFGPALSDLTNFFVRVQVNTDGVWGDWKQSEFTSNFVTSINVPGDFSTIQEAVDMASNGDTILVGPGTYTENIIVEAKVLLLLSTDGADVTIIEPVLTSGTVLSFLNGGSSASVVDGFTVRDGVRNILGEHSAITVRNCLLLNASDVAIRGYKSEGATTIVDNRFEGNRAACELAYCSGLIENNLVINNVFNGVSAPAIWVDNCDSPVVRGNIVVGTEDLGIKVGYSLGAMVFGNTCYDNEGGIYLYYSPGCDLRNNVCAFNTETWGIQLRFGDSTDIYGYNNSYGNYPIDFVSFEPSATSLTQDPLFTDTAGYNFTPLPGSPCIDAGDPDPIFNDPDGTRSDIGAVPGAPANWPIPHDLEVGPTGEAGRVVSLTPEISWSYQDTASTIQSEYHLQIGSDDDWSTAELWDTGPVVASDTSLTYSGPALTDFTRYYLRLRVHNGTDWGDWTLAPFAIKIGSVIHVPADQSTVQDAIEFTVDGDSVLVGPGTYTDRFNFQGKKIVVKSTDGPEVTVLEGDPEGPTMVSFIGGEDSTSVLDGFRLQGSSRHISVGSNAAAKIVNNRLLGGQFGVFSYYVCLGLVIRGNYFEGSESAIHLNNGTCFIENNVITGTGLGSNRSCVSLKTHTGSMIRGNLFFGNFVGDWEGVVKLRNGENNRVFNNTLFGNYSINPEDTASYGILVQFEDADSILNNIVAFNPDMTGIGRGFYPNGTHTIEYNNVYSNGDGNYSFVSPGLGSISVDPAFTDTANLDLSLTSASPCIDAGHPGFEFNDPDGTTNDMGAITFDGPFNFPLAQSIGVEAGDMSHVILPTPTIRWLFFDTVGTSSGHEIEVGSDPDWTTAEMWAPGPVFVTDTFVTYAGVPLVPSANYYLRIRLYNGAAWGDWRNKAFHTNAVPAMPLVVGPVSGDTSSTHGGLDVTASTDDDGDPLTYDFEVFSDPGLSLLVWSANVPGGAATINSGPLEDLSHDLAYWWRARAGDGYEVSPWTATQQFHVTKSIILNDMIGGSLAAGTLDCGRTVEFRFRLTNDYAYGVRGLVNGMRIYSPDQAAFEPIEAEWDFSAVDWFQLFDMLVGAAVYDGPQADTAMFNAVLLTGEGLASGVSYPAWKVRVEVDCSEEGKTLCLDSVMTNGQGLNSWIWAVGSGAIQYVAPEWNGPFCFTIQRCCFEMRGDLNGDGADADIADLTYLVDYMFRFGAPPVCLQEANINGDPEDQIDISDLTYLVEYMFVGGPAPYSCDIVSTAPLAKAAVIPEVTLTASYDNDTTVIVYNSPVSLRGVQMTLRGTDEFRPRSGLSSGLELFSSRQDSTITLGILDIDGGEVIRHGTNTLVSIPGRFELIDARVSDMDHRTIYPLTKSGKREVELPTTFSLGQNYPNPFNPATRIDYALPTATDVRIDIFNILGQRVRTLKNGHMPAGWHAVTWNGNDRSGEQVASGVYFYRIQTDQQNVTKKMLLLK